MSSSSSRVSATNIYSGYNLVSPLDQEILQQKQITPIQMLQVFLTVIQGKLSDGSTKEYSLQEKKDAIEVLSKDKKDKEKMVELGWSKKRGFLYTTHKSSSKFQDYLFKMAPLSQDEISNLLKRKRGHSIPSFQEQLLIFETICERSFTSPFFAMQYSHPKEFVSLPRTCRKMTKVLPDSSMNNIRD